MTLPLEQQVCSLEPAKKLRELGVEQQSLFFISERDGRIISNEEYYDFLDFAANVGGGSVEQFYSAFTAAELGEIIPASVEQTTVINEKVDSAHIFFIRYDDDDSDCDGTNPDTCVKKKWHAECGRKKIRELTEANARAALLIYLIEQGFIDPKTLSL